MPAPCYADGGELGVPLFAKGIEFGFGIIDGGGSINALEISSDHLAIFPGDKIQTIAHHMHDAQLDFGLRKDALNGIREAGEAVQAGNQNVADTAISELGQYIVIRTSLPRSRQSTGP